MPLIKRFEDLHAWQGARELTTRAVYAFTKESHVCRDYGFVDQIRRASVSIMNNIYELAERVRGLIAGFIQYLQRSRTAPDLNSSTSARQNVRTEN